MMMSIALLLLSATAIGLVIELLIPSARLKVLYSRLGDKVRLSRLYETYIVTAAANLIAPLRLGSVLVRPAILKRLGGVSLRSSYSTIAVEQVLDITMEAFVFLISIYIIGFSVGSGMSFTLITSALALIVFILLFYEKRMVTLFEKMMLLAERVAPKRAIGFINGKTSLKKKNVLDILRGMQKKEGRTKGFLAVIGLSVVAILYSPLPLMGFLNAVSIDMGYMQAFAVFWLPYSLGKVSGIPGGYGVREGSMALAMAQLGIPLDAALGAAVLFRVFSVAVVGILGAVISVRIGVSVLRPKHPQKAF